MIPILGTNSRIFELKIYFLTFAWAKPFIYQNDQCKKIYSFGDFEHETPTHMGATHAIPKFQPKFQNRISRELDQNFYMPGIGMIH